MIEREPTLGLALAREARRAGLLSGLWQLRRKVTIADLGDLMLGEYGDDLAELTVSDVIGPVSRRLVLADCHESIEDAIMSVFEGRPGVRLTSSFFTRHLGIPRWTAQKLLADLAVRGWLDREGKTSGTNYCLAAWSRTRARVGPRC